MTRNSIIRVEPRSKAKNMNSEMIIVLGLLLAFEIVGP